MRPAGVDACKSDMIISGNLEMVVKENLGLSVMFEMSYKYIKINLKEFIDGKKKVH